MISDRSNPFYADNVNSLDEYHFFTGYVFDLTGPPFPSDSMEDDFTVTASPAQKLYKGKVGFTRTRRKPGNREQLTY